MDPKHRLLLLVQENHVPTVDRLGMQAPHNKPSLCPIQVPLHRWEGPAHPHHLTTSAICSQIWTLIRCAQTRSAKETIGSPSSTLMFVVL